MADDTYLERGEKIAERCLAAIKSFQRHPIRLLSVREVVIETNEYALDETLELLEIVQKQITALTLFNQRTRSKAEIHGGRLVQHAILKEHSNWSRLQRLSISAFLRYPETLYKWLKACPNIKYLHVHNADRHRHFETTLWNRDQARREHYTFSDNFFSQLTAINLPTSKPSWFLAEVLLPVLKASPRMCSITDLGDYFDQQYGGIPASRWSNQVKIPSDRDIHADWQSQIPKTGLYIGQGPPRYHNDEKRTGHLRIITIDDANSSEETEMRSRVSQRLKTSWIYRQYIDNSGSRPRYGFISECAYCHPHYDGSTFGKIVRNAGCG